MSENGNKHNKYKLIDILIVEDDNDHARLIVWALKSLGWLQSNIIHLNDGQKALGLGVVAFIRKTATFEELKEKMDRMGNHWGLLERSETQYNS